MNEIIRYAIVLIVGFALGFWLSPHIRAWIKKEATKV